MQKVIKLDLCINQIKRFQQVFISFYIIQITYLALLMQ